MLKIFKQFTTKESLQVITAWSESARKYRKAFITFTVLSANPNQAVITWDCTNL